MCGIVGQINFGGVVSKNFVAKILDGLRHRGPDHQDIWESKFSNCVLGHARLSILDLSNFGNQPMIDIESGNVIVFNGEIYNFNELKNSSILKGEKFVSNSDTEVILKLYNKYQENCLSHLDGMFAFAIWDNKKETLFFARDRVGKKPFFYHVENGCFSFSSELNPLAKKLLLNKNIDNKALSLYLKLGYIPAPYTIYSNVSKLLPGHYGVVDKAGLVIKKYYKRDFKSKIKISQIDATHELENLLVKAVQKRLIADVPVGALLSGGLDSSLIVAIMSSLRDEKVKTFSVGFKDESFNELNFSKKVANSYKTDHHEMISNSDISTDELLLIAQRYGEPFADSSALPSFLVCNYASKYVKVALNGDGADELFGGYSRYRISKDSDLTIKLLSKLGYSKLKLSSNWSNKNSSYDKLKKKLLSKYIMPSMLSLPVSNEFFDIDEVETLMFKKNEGLVDWLDSEIIKSQESTINSQDNSLWFDNHNYLPYDLLVKMDIASMSNGLELRSPFLDKEIIDFSDNLSYDMKISGNYGKVLLRKIAENYLPKEIIYRNKMGFSIPLENWLRNDMRKSILDVICDEESMSGLDMSYVSQIKTRFFNGESFLATRVWTLYMYGNWNRINK